MFLRLLFIVITIAFGSFSYGASQKIHFTKGDLNISGKFPFNSSQELAVNGHDKKGKAYTFVVAPKTKAKNIYQLTYKLTYLGEKTSGSITIEEGKEGRLKSMAEDNPEQASSFSVKILK